jgi:hypothetical protein
VRGVTAVRRRLAAAGAAQLDAIAALAGSRLWFHEREFALDHQLRARPEQVVILDLEPGGRGKRIRNSIPFVFPLTRAYSICAPAGDPYIQSVQVQREGSNAVVVNVPRGGPCKQRTIEAGLYRLVGGARRQPDPRGRREGVSARAAHQRASWATPVPARSPPPARSVSRSAPRAACMSPRNRTKPCTCRASPATS